MSRSTCYLLLLLLAHTVLVGCAHQKASVSPEAQQAQGPQSKPAAAEAKAEPQAARATEEPAPVTKAPRPARRTPKAPRPAPAESPEPAPAPEPAPPAASSVRAFGPGMSKPVKLSGPEPVYTPEAVAQRAQGLFIARCIVTREGQVKDCRVLKPVPYMTEAVLQALQQQRYKPAMLNGEPIDVEYSFNLRLSPPGGS